MARHSTSVTPLFTAAPSAPDRVAAELVAVLPRAQLAASYEYQLSYLAGPMYARVGWVFGGAHAPVYLLTERRRRSVWNAVLAIRHPSGDMAQLRKELLETKSKALLKRAYGHLPRGFTCVLKKCGETAQEPDFYRFWHAYLTDHPEDFPMVASRGIFDARLTDQLRRLPPALARLPVIDGFSARHVERLVEVMTYIHQGRPEPTLWESLAERLIAGENPLNIVTKLTDALTFAPPCIKYDRRFRHIGSVRDLKQTALRFENCLGEPQALRTALQGTHQFYEYHDGEDSLVVSITSDPPCGFMIDDIRQKGNKPLERGQRERLTSALADFGIVWRRSVFETIQDWDYPRAYAALFAEDP